MAAEDKRVFLDYCGYISSEDLNHNVVNKMSDCCLAQNKTLWIFFFLPVGKIFSCFGKHNYRDNCHSRNKVLRLRGFLPFLGAWNQFMRSVK